MVEVIIVEINKNGFITYLMRYNNTASISLLYLFLALSSIYWLHVAILFCNNKSEQNIERRKIMFIMNIIAYSITLNKYNHWTISYKTTVFFDKKIKENVMVLQMSLNEIWMSQVIFLCYLIIVFYAKKLKQKHKTSL